MLYRFFLSIRATLFYLGYNLFIAWFGLTGALLGLLLPYRLCFRYITLWNTCTLFWLRVTCGVRYQVLGRENLPDTPCVILAKHQSQWETFFIQMMIKPTAMVLKQELLKLPVFGWGLRMLKPIAIDRSNPKQALRMILEQGVSRLEEGITVAIFPEGTRTQPGQRGRYARSGVDIAIRAGVPVVPVALNAGNFWPSDRFIKYPGTITVSIGEPISTEEANSKALIKAVEEWIESTTSQLDAEALQQLKR